MFQEDRIWQTQKAKAEFSRLVKEAQEKGDQMISNRQEIVAVLMSKKRYNALTKRPTSLLSFFKKAPLPDVDLEIERAKDIPREVDLWPTYLTPVSYQSYGKFQNTLTQILKRGCANMMSHIFSSAYSLLERFNKVLAN